MVITQACGCPVSLSLPIQTKTLSLIPKESSSMCYFLPFLPFLPVSISSIVWASVPGKVKAPISFSIAPKSSFSRFLPRANYRFIMNSRSMSSVYSYLTALNIEAKSNVCSSIVPIFMVSKKSGELHILGCSLGLKARHLTKWATSPRVRTPLKT